MALTTETENKIASKKRQRCQTGMCEREKFSLNNFSVQNDSSKKKNEKKCHAVATGNGDYGL